MSSFFSVSSDRSVFFFSLTNKTNDDFDECAKDTYIIDFGDGCSFCGY
jgi:hypothetical protein